jgi:serine/threonine-protein kinase
MARFDTDAGAQGRRIGRYEVLGEIASGGMATVYLARSLGAKGFSRLVAIKRLHPHLEAEDDFVQMFLDEARLAARIRHPNVVATLDVEDSEGLYIVMEYIEGVTLLTLSRAAQ